MRLLILASSSPIRARLLGAAGIDFATDAASIDEDALREAFAAEGVAPRDQADALAEMKALRAAGRHPEGLVLGCDQVLEHRGEVLGKPVDADAARTRLERLRGDTHRLHTAAVLVDHGRPVWRHIATASLTMRLFSDALLTRYVDSGHWALTATSGGYAIEDFGMRLFERIEGDHFGILGLPLVELLATLARRGDIEA